MVVEAVIIFLSLLDMALTLHLIVHERRPKGQTNPLSFRYIAGVPRGPEELRLIHDPIIRFVFEHTIFRKYR